MGTPITMPPDPDVAPTASGWSRRTRALRVAGFLGIRSITRGNRAVLALTAFLMALVYAQLLFIPSLIQGAIERVEGELRGSLTSNIAGAPAGASTTIDDTDALLRDIRSTEGVEAATSTLLAGTQIVHENATGSWSVLAVRPDEFGEVFDVPADMIEGSFLDAADTNAIVLGVGVAGADRTTSASYRSSLQTVHAGDTVTVTLLNGQEQSFVVKGIYETQLTPADQRAFVNRSALDAVAPQVAGKSTGVFVRTREVGDEAAVVERLRGKAPNVRFETWQGLSVAVKDQTDSFNIIKSILNVVALLVAAITVFIVTYVDLVSKRRTIGIERAIGITPASLTASYALRAVVFAIIGVALGAAIFLGVIVPVVHRHPFQFPTGPVELSVSGRELRRDALILMTVAVVGAVIPASRSVRVRLIEAIWG